MEEHEINNKKVFHNALLKSLERNKQEKLNIEADLRSVYIFENDSQSFLVKMFLRDKLLKKIQDIKTIEKLIEDLNK